MSWCCSSNHLHGWRRRPSAPERGPSRHVVVGDGGDCGCLAVLAIAAQLDRDYIRDMTLEGQQTAAAERPPRRTLQSHRRRHAHLRPPRQGRVSPHIAAELTIKTGKDTGQKPSVASVYRAFADAMEQTNDPA